MGRRGRAQGYARALWRVLELVSVPGSIDYRVRARDCAASEFLVDAVADGGSPVSAQASGEWWRPVAVA